MAFDELELKRIDHTVGELCRKSSPPEHADQLRTAYQVEGHSVTMYEERPPWDGAGEWTRAGASPASASTAHAESGSSTGCVRTCAGIWYDPDEIPADLASLVAVVEADKYGAFFG